MGDGPDIFDAYNASIDEDAPYSFNVKKGHAGVPPEFAEASAARRAARAATAAEEAATMGPVIPKLERAVRGSAAHAAKVSGLMGKALKFVNSPPAIAAMMLPMGVNIIKNLTRAARQAHEQDIYVNQLLDLEFKERAENRRRAQEQRQRGMLRDENARRLAMYAPHLYNQVMAGRKLPKNAVVIGGTPRTDLLEELASSMADGAWGGD